MTDKQSLNILILTNYFPPEVGAASHLYYELAGELVKDHHNVTVLTRFPRQFDQRTEIKGDRKGLFNWENINGIKVLRIKIPHFPRFIPLAREAEHLFNLIAFLLGALFIKRPDVILVYSPPIVIGLVAVMAGKIKRIPTVVNIQDLFPKYVIQVGILKNKLLIAVCEYFEKLLYRLATIITVYSIGNKKYIAGRSIDEDKIRIIPNWIDTEFMRPLEPSHDPNNKFVVLFAGSMGHPQDMDIIIDSAKILEGQGEILFLLVGDGPKAPDAKKRAEELRLNNVRFMPLQPRSKYPQLLASAHIALVTINKNMTTPVVPSKLLGIMAGGKPFIASMPLDGGDAPRIIKESGGGILIDAGNVDAFSQAVMRLYKDPALRREMGINSRSYAEKTFSLRKCTHNYEELFRSIIK